MESLNISVTVKRGQEIRQACDDAKVLSEQIMQEIEFEFNGTSITTEDQSINEMVDSYMKQRY